MSEGVLFDKEVLAKAQIFSEKHALFRKTFTLSEAEYVIQNYHWYEGLLMRISNSFIVALQKDTMLVELCTLVQIIFVSPIRCPIIRYVSSY